MAPDPLHLQPATDSLQSSTAMPMLSPESLDQVGAQAARMVDETVRAKGRRGARKAVEARVAADDGAVSEPVAEAVASEVAPPVAAELISPEPMAVSEPVLPDPLPEVAEIATTPQSLDAPEDAAQVVRTPDDAAGTAVEAAQVPDMIEAATQKAEAASEAVGSLAAFNAAMAGAFSTNIGSTMTFWTALLETRSIVEAAALNRRHVYKQVEAMTEQNHALLMLAQQMVFEAWSGLVPGERRAGA